MKRELVYMQEIVLAVLRLARSAQLKGHCLMSVVLVLIDLSLIRKV